MRGAGRAGNAACLALAVVLSLLNWPNSALAGDCEAPCVGYEFSAELENDFTFAADPSFLTSNELQPTLTTDYYFAPSDNFTLFTSIASEAVVDPEPGENAAFQGLGTYAGELYALFDFEPFALRAGKFDTVFSLLSEADPSINGANLASAFDADERWGVEGVLGFEAMDINHTIAATLFTTDRTFLSESLFTNRGRFKLSDGGAGNTEGISSVAVALSGCKGVAPAECFEDGEFGYRVGFRHQRAGHPTPDQIDEGQRPRSEQAFFAAGTANFEIADETTLRLMGETAYVSHFEGDQDDALIVTGLAALDRGPMRYIAAYSEKRNFIAGEPDSRERLFDLEAIYLSGDDTPFEGSSWNLGAAYTFERNEERQDTHLFTLRATLDYAGSTEFGK